MEILEAGAKGHFYLELVTREEDRATGREEEMEQELARIFRGFRQEKSGLEAKRPEDLANLKSKALAKKLYKRQLS